MDESTLRRLRNHAIMLLILGFVSAGIGDIIVLTSKNELLLKFASLLVSIGLFTFLDGSFKLLSYRRKLAKMKEKSSSEFDETENNTDSMEDSERSKPKSVRLIYIFMLLVVIGFIFLYLGQEILDMLKTNFF